MQKKPPQKQTKKTTRLAHRLFKCDFEETSKLAFVNFTSLGQKHIWIVQHAHPKYICLCRYSMSIRMLTPFVGFAKADLSCSKLEAVCF